MDFHFYFHFTRMEKLTVMFSKQRTVGQHFVNKESRKRGMKTGGFEMRNGFACCRNFIEGDKRSDNLD